MWLISIFFKCYFIWNHCWLPTLDFISNRLFVVLCLIHSISVIQWQQSDHNKHIIVLNGQGPSRRLRIAFIAIVDCEYTGSEVYTVTPCWLGQNTPQQIIWYRAVDRHQMQRNLPGIWICVNFHLLHDMTHSPFQTLQTKYYNDHWI